MRSGAWPSDGFLYRGLVGRSRSVHVHSSMGTNGVVLAVALVKHKKKYLEHLPGVRSAAAVMKCHLAFCDVFGRRVMKLERPEFSSRNFCFCFR